MTDQEFRAFLDVLMQADPWPYGEDAEKLLLEYADRRALEAGFDTWIDAYHRLEAS